MINQKKLPIWRSLIGICPCWARQKESSRNALQYWLLEDHLINYEFPKKSWALTSRRRIFTNVKKKKMLRSRDNWLSHVYTVKEPSGGDTRRFCSRWDCSMHTRFQQSRVVAIWDVQRIRKVDGLIYWFWFGPRSIVSASHISGSIHWIYSPETCDRFQ